MFAGFPLVIQLFLVVFLIGLSGIFCGLTIGVMGTNIRPDAATSAIAWPSGARNARPR